MRRHLLLSLGMSCCGALASPCKPSNPNLPSTTVTSYQLGGSTSSATGSTLASTTSTFEETAGSSTILTSLSSDSTSASIKSDLESLLSATTASSTESLSTSALTSLSEPSSTASTESGSSIWEPSTTSETAMISVSSVEMLSTSHLSTTLTTSTDTTSTDTATSETMSTDTTSTTITSTSAPSSSDPLIESIATSTTDILSTLSISSIPSMSSHTISSPTESLSVSVIDSTTLTTTVPTSSDTTTSSPASTSSAAPLLFKAIVQDGPAALTPARLAPAGERIFSIGTFWDKLTSPIAHKLAILTIDPTTGQLMLSDGTQICVQYEYNRKSGRVRACGLSPGRDNTYITCDRGSKPGDVLQCKAPVLFCTLENGAKSCQSTERESTQFYGLYILSQFWTLYMGGPEDQRYDNLAFGVNLFIEKI